MLIAHLLRMMAALDIARDGLHRARSVQGNDCGDIFDRLRTQSGYDVGDACRLELEHPHGASLTEHLEGRRVVVGYLLDREIRRMAANHLLSVRDNRQVAQTQKVHLEQAKFFECGHGELGHHLLIVARQRYIGVNRVFGDDHARRMGGCVARHTLERPCGVDQILDRRVAVIHLLELRVDGQCTVNGNMQFHRHLFGNRVGLIVRNGQRASDIADGRAGCHGTKGDDLCNVVGPVLSGHILNDLGTAHIAEIDVDIRHGHAFRV